MAFSFLFFRLRRYYFQKGKNKPLPKPITFAKLPAGFRSPDLHRRLKCGKDTGRQ